MNFFSLQNFIYFLNNKINKNTTIIMSTPYLHQSLWFEYPCPLGSTSYCITYKKTWHSINPFHKKCCLKLKLYEFFSPNNDQINLINHVCSDHFMHNLIHYSSTNKAKIKFQEWKVLSWINPIGECVRWVNNFVKILNPHSKFWSNMKVNVDE
jgi:hypothetical protein